MEYRILVCGGRDYNDWDQVCWALAPYKSTETVIIHGGARGADSLAFKWAKENNIPYKTYLANWERYGKSAGFIRNKQMLDEGKPDLVIAFPGGKGTKMMVDIAKKAGVEVIEVYG